MGAAIAIAVASVISMFVIIGHNIAAIGRVDVGITAFAQSELPPGKQFGLQGPDPRYPGGDPSMPDIARYLTKTPQAKGFFTEATSPHYDVWLTTRHGITVH